MDRIEELLSHKPKIKEAEHAVFLDDIKGYVKFKRVSFGYDNNRDILSGVDFEVKESQTIALTGKSGAGKTTIINLLLRFYDPTGGAIFIDGYWLLDNKKIRVLRTANLLHRVKETFRREVPPFGAADIVICVGSEEIGVPGNIARTGSSVDIVRGGPAGEWMTRTKACEELAL